MQILGQIVAVRTTTAQTGCVSRELCCRPVPPMTARRTCCSNATVLVNGLPLPDAAGRRNLSFEPDGPGFVRLTVMDGRGATDSVMVRLQ
jgi:hypothetical protein